MILPLLLAAATMPATHAVGGFGAPLREGDAGRTIAAGRGTTVVIVLTGNAGTGYRWALHKTVNAVPAAPIATVADAATGPGAVGGPLVTTASFRLDHPGSAEVDMELDPPGRNRMPARVLRYWFEVR